MLDSLDNGNSKVLELEEKEKNNRLERGRGLISMKSRHWDLAMI